MKMFFLNDFIRLVIIIVIIIVFIEFFFLGFREVFYTRVEEVGSVV